MSLFKDSQQDVVNHTITSQHVITLSISSPMMRMAAVGASSLAAEDGLEAWFVDMVALQS